jgi:hypothetical protein
MSVIGVLLLAGSAVDSSLLQALPGERPESRKTEQNPPIAADYQDEPKQVEVVGLAANQG